MLGYMPEEMVGLQWKDIVAPQHTRGSEEAEDDWIYGDTGRYENALITRCGDYIPVIISMRGLREDASPTGDGAAQGRRKRGGNGQAGVVIVFTDITKRVEVEQALRRSERCYRELAQENAELLAQARRDAETKDLLLNEVNHRVKNNLTAIIGLLYAQQRRPEFNDNPIIAQATKDLVGRIQGLATVHSMLSATGWEPLPLTDLAGQIVIAVSGGLPPEKCLEVEVAPSPVLISPDQAHNLAIVFTELATNTVKHTMNDRDRAFVSICTDVCNGVVKLLYRDDGHGQIEDIEKEHQAVGLYLIRNIVQHGLRGTVELHQAGGLEIMLTFKQEVPPVEIGTG